MPPRSQSDVRVLMVEPDARVRTARAKALTSAGYKVSAVADVDGTPSNFPPHLYDVIVIDADSKNPAPLDWCKRVGGRAGGAPVVVVLAHSGFAVDATFVPTLVISERSQRDADDRLVAFLAACAPDRGTGLLR